MARYIDEEQAVGIGYLSDWYQQGIDGTVPPVWTDEHLEELTNDFVIIPKDTPTADVQEVKHGKWLNKVNGYYWFGKCSECGASLNLSDCSIRMNYCPNCGAKMDKE